MCTFLEPEQGRARLPDLGHEPIFVLFLLGRQFQVPFLDFRPGGDAFRVEENPDPLAIELVEQAQGETAQVQNLEPAVARGAGGEQLDGVGQAVARFADRIVEDALGQAPDSFLNHDAAEDYSRRGVSVKGGGQFVEFFVCVTADLHFVSLA